MQPTIETIRMMMQHIKYDSIEQTFKDKYGKDRKHFKKGPGRWYVSITIDKKQYSVLAHQFVYYVYNHTQDMQHLPSLTFNNGDYNDLKPMNIIACKSKIKELKGEKKDLTEGNVFKLYFANIDRQKLLVLLNQNEILYSTSYRNLSRKDKTRTKRATKQKSKGIFPIKCGNTFALICSESNLIQLDHSGPNL